MFNSDYQIAFNRLTQRARDYLNEEAFLEVNTPSITTRAIPESTIELFETTRCTQGNSQTLYLLPSPEKYMKRILTQTHKPIYQFSRSFRNSEETNQWHLNEFTMLEWYVPDYTCDDSIELAKRFLAHLASEINIDLSFKTLSIKEMFLSLTGEKLEKCQNKERIQEVATKCAVSHHIPKDESWADTFNRIFVSLIEPYLSSIFDPVFVCDYPIGIPALAKPNKDGISRERWEIYFKGVEIANCYSEETDSSLIEKFFETETKAKQIINPSFKEDSELKTMPMINSSGTSWGWDRVVSLLIGLQGIPQFFD